MVAAGELGAIRVVRSSIRRTGSPRRSRRPARSRRLGAPTPRAAAPAARSATSAPTPSTSPNSSPACEVEAVAADLHHLRARAAGSTTTRSMLLRFAGGARGALWCSQVAPGHENGLRLRVYGEKGAARMGAGTSRPAALYAVRQAPPAPARGGPAAGAAAGARDAHPGRPSRGLSRSLRADLSRCRRADPRAPRRYPAAGGMRPPAGRSGRAARIALRCCLREFQCWREPNDADRSLDGRVDLNSRPRRKPAGAAP